MRSIRFWIPAIIGAMVTAVFLFLPPTGGDHAGAGLGEMLLLYPVPLFTRMIFAGNPLSDAFLSRIINVLAVAGVIVQFPLYGFVISYAKLKQSFLLKVCAGVIWVHIVVIVVSLAIVLIHSL